MRRPIHIWGGGAAVVLRNLGAMKPMAATITIAAAPITSFFGTRMRSFRFAGACCGVGGTVNGLSGSNSGRFSAGGVRSATGIRSARLGAFCGGADTAGGPCGAGVATTIGG